MQTQKPEYPLHGALLINKHPGVTSFGIIEILQKLLGDQLKLKRRDWPKLGHGGTLDPFATGLLIVCVGRGVKLARYFLGSRKTYEGVIRFGETTVPGDPTAPVSERSDKVPASREEVAEMARKLTLQPYLQTPPMHSAKKKNGRPLYELAREGIEVEREPKLCRLYQFDVPSYEAPRARFLLRCSSGTYVRTLAQDIGKLLDSVALVESLSRSESGGFRVSSALTTDQIAEAMVSGQAWDELPAWVPFDRLLLGYDRANATREEASALMQGRSHVLLNLLRRVEAAPLGARDPKDDEGDDESSPLESGAERKRGGPPLAIYCDDLLIGIARSADGVWGMERVFTRDMSR